MKSIIFLLSIFLIVSCSDTSTTNSDSDVQTEAQTVEQTNNQSVESEATSTDVDMEEGDDMMEDVSSDAEEVATEVNDVAVDESNTSPTALKEVSQNNEVSTMETANKMPEAKEELEMPQSTGVPLKPDHGAWDALLRKNVSSSGKVNYSGMKASAKELEAYVTYLESFATRDSWTRNEKLAYWINLYNAATVRLIVQNYPIASITKLSGGKPWDQNIVKIGTKSYTLNDIENKIIRPRFKDGRIHFAVNCAAKSCPPLMNSAFKASSLNRQLEKQTTSFINSSENTLAADKVEISKIFDWYKGDFEGGDVVAFLNKYSKTPINSDATIEHKTYNWDLNK